MATFNLNVVVWLILVIYFGFILGLFLTATGAIVLASGIYDLLDPPVQRTVLAELHPGVWWGATIFLAGVLFFLTHRNKTVE